MKPSRTVTRPRCITCGRKFVSHRADARYCSGRCRQRANRARHTSADIDRQIEAARRLYWDLIRRKAEARGASVSQVLTDEAMFVDGDGNVYASGATIGPVGPVIGKAAPMTGGRAGWSTWGLEAAGRPFDPPPCSTATIDGKMRLREKGGA